MDNTEIIGHIGSILSSLTFMTQVYHTWKTRSVNDLNIYMLMIVFSSTIVWIIYGYNRGLLPVMICNSIICVLSMVLIFFKLEFREKEQ